MAGSSDFSVIIRLLEAGLDLWRTKESRKYVDQKIALVREWNEEWKKPDGVRSDARLDDIKLRLRELAIAFASSASKAGGQDVATGP